MFIFDDLHTIPENQYIKDIKYVPLFFQGHYTSLPDIPQGMFRPFLMLTFVFNYYFSGLAPLGFHLVNILMHFLNAIMLYSLLKELSKKAPFGFLALISLLFVTHPVNTEAVSYISCRSDLLVTLLITGALLLYIKRRYAFSLLLYVLALLTKESALVFVLLAETYDFLYPQEGR